MDNLSLICLPSAFLLGATPSSFIVAMLAAKIDIRDEPDGKISAAAVYRRVGLLPFIIAVVMDMGKGALAVLIAQWLYAGPLLVMLAGLVAIVSHQWSIFLRFQGGRGATVMAGVLVCICTVPTLIGAAVAGMMALWIKNNSASFGIGIVALFAALFALQWSDIAMPPILIVTPSLPPPLTPYQVLIGYPVLLGLLMTAKALQVKYRPGATLRPGVGGNA
ncbi:MAG: glycerol-3-phosphate acyltransferase [Dehalococcoidia bacterium]|nr:glycerol-3-phosphate acyltransferase [Dehalococcoidia bacterium]MDD5648425.1 glycerol-3-phosphate acyltransferase [Dehalococcoidia bacterium]